MHPSPRFQLQLFGTPALLTPDGVRLGGRAVQRHRLALLSLLALAPGSAMSRDKLMALLWPERDTDHGRKLLNQSVYALRHTLGDEALLTGADVVRLNEERVRSDVAEFESALARRELERAVALHRAPFLDGFFVPQAAEFEEWVERERARLATSCGDALEALAEAAEAEGRAGAAARWWRALAAHDPYDSRVALRLMRALEASGHRAAALQHAAHHERLLQEELGTEPESVIELAERLRRVPQRPREPAAEAQSIDARAADGAAAVADAAGDTSDLTVPVASASSLLRLRVIAAFAAVVLLAVVLFATRPSSIPPTVALAAVPARGTEDVAAHDLFVRGTDPARLRTDSTAREALDYLRQAVAIDPNYAAAWASLARMYSRVGSAYAETQRPQYDSIARAAALKAVALDDALAEAHAALGMIHMRSFEAGAAETHLLRALELEPTSSLAREWLISAYLWTGRAPDALREARHALALDPLSPLAHAILARTLLANDRCDEAFEHLTRIATLDPPLLRAAPIQALCYARRDRWAEAIAVLRPQAERGEPNAFALLAYMLARSGREADARRMRATALERWRSGYGNVYQLAVISAGLRDFVDAFAWLDSATARGTPVSAPGLTLSLILMGPLAEELADDPRFESIRGQLLLTAHRSKQ